MYDSNYMYLSTLTYKTLSIDSIVNIHNSLTLFLHNKKKKCSERLNDFIEYCSFTKK